MNLSDIPAGTVISINPETENNEISCIAIGPFANGLLVTPPTYKNIPLNTLENFSLSYTDPNGNPIHLNCAMLKPIDILNGKFHLLEGLDGIEPPRPKRRSERHIVAVYGNVITNSGESHNVMIYDISMNGISFVDLGGNQYYNGQIVQFRFTSRNLKMNVASEAEVTRHFSMKNHSAIGCRVPKPSIEMINYISTVRKLRAERLEKLEKEKLEKLEKQKRLEKLEKEKLEKQEKLEKS